MTQRTRERDAGQPPDAHRAGARTVCDDEPDSPTELGRRSWIAVLKRTWSEFREDDLTDRAAALTYYGILSLFPGLHVLVSLLALVGASATQPARFSSCAIPSDASASAAPPGASPAIASAATTAASRRLTRPCG